MGTERNAPAFQLYADDFLAGTADMTDAEVGVYMRMLCLQWTKGGIGERQKRAFGMKPKTVETVLKMKFDKDDSSGTWRNKRLAHMAEVNKKRGEAGRTPQKSHDQSRIKSQSNRDQKPGQTGEQNGPPPSPSPSPNNTHTPGAHERWQAEWSRWVDSWEGRCGARFDPIRAELQLHELHALPPDKAKRDLQFSLKKYAQNILDSDHDFAAARASGGKPRQPPTKPGDEVPDAEETRRRREARKARRTA